MISATSIPRPNRREAAAPRKNTAPRSEPIGGEGLAFPSPLFLGAADVAAPGRPLIVSADDPTSGPGG